MEVILDWLKNFGRIKGVQKMEVFKMDLWKKTCGCQKKWLTSISTLKLMC